MSSHTLNKAEAEASAIRQLAPAGSLKTVHQPQPRRPPPPAFNTILRLPKTSQTSKVHNWLASCDHDQDQQQQQPQQQHSYSHLFSQISPPLVINSARALSDFEDQEPSLPSDLHSDASMNSRATSARVRDPRYRQGLAVNHIHLRPRREKLPPHVQSLADEMFRGRQSPEPAVEHIENDTSLTDLLDIDGSETQVYKCFQRHIFEDPSKRFQGLRTTDLFYSIRQQHVPDLLDTVSKPKPDILYGYHTGAFTLEQQQFMDPHWNEFTANSQQLVLPFLFIELKGDDLGPTAGSLWVATNQCLSGAASCIHIVERLNGSIEQHPLSTISPVDTVAFSIAMNGSEARLFISWKEGEGYYTQQIKGLLVQEPEHYLLLRRFVRNVLEWGKDHRQPQIGAVFDALREQEQTRRKRALDALREQEQTRRKRALDALREQEQTQRKRPLMLLSLRRPLHIGPNV